MFEDELEEELGLKTQILWWTPFALFVIGDVFALSFIFQNCSEGNQGWNGFALVMFWWGTLPLMILSFFVQRAKTSTSLPKLAKAVLLVFMYLIAIGVFVWVTILSAHALFDPIHTCDITF